MTSFSSRKLIHLLSSIIPLSYIFLNKNILLTVVSFLLIGFIAVEIIRFKSTRIKGIFNKIFWGMLKREEEKKITGATWVLISSLLCIAFFKKEVAIISLLFMTVSDSIASFAGYFLGKHKLFSKTIEGSIFFFITSFFITLFFSLNFYLKIFASFLGTLIEVMPLPLDDNLSVPLLTGGMLQILT